MDPLDQLTRLLAIKARADAVIEIRQQFARDAIREGHYDAAAEHVSKALAAIESAKNEIAAMSKDETDETVQKP